MDVRDIILKPLISEKAVAAMSGEHPKYAFKVRLDANKFQIKDAVETIFGVTVTSVNTMRMHGKVRRMGKFQGRRSDWKKAVVTLKAGESIKVFEGL
ncbi:MAG TPA: 50S ribosomal protein L23 [Symbiobacteriaceae bacterium]|nr:50S ribosomal protein L23 [Symbiobacteriaceae bacterium]